MRLATQPLAGFQPVEYSRRSHSGCLRELLQRLWQSAGLVLRAAFLADSVAGHALSACAVRVDCFGKAKMSGLVIRGIVAGISFTVVCVG